MHYLVLASEYDDVGDIWVVQRTFTSNFKLTKEQLERMFLVAHWKENAEESASEPIDNWTEEDFQTLYLLRRHLKQC